MSTALSNGACDVSSTSKPATSHSENERALMRDRKKEKQLRYQRHKTRMNTGSPPESHSPPPVMTPSRESSPLKGPVMQSSPIRAASSPSRRKELSSPYIQTILAVTGKKETSPMPSPVASPERSTAFPKRGITRSVTPQGRKSNLVQQMRAKKKNTPPMNHVVSDKVDVRQLDDSVGMPSEQHQVHEPNARHPVDDVKVSGPGGESTVDSDCPLDENIEDENKQYLSEPASGTLLESTHIEPDNHHQIAEIHDVPEDTSGSPTREPDTKALDLPNCSYDMRSIHDFPPDPPKDINDEKGTTGVDFSTDVATAVNTTCQEHVRFMVDTSDFPLEEKKEKEFSELQNQLQEPMDSSWDASNPVFVQKFSLDHKVSHTDKSNSSAFDAFDTSSWEVASATFSDVDYPMSSVKDETTGDRTIPDLATEQKNMADDSKLIVQLTGSRDKIASRSDHTRLPSSHLSPRKRLETPKEHEPMLFETGYEHFQFDIKEDYPSMDESSLLGIVSKSEDDNSSRYRLVATSHELVAFHMDATAYDKRVVPPIDQPIDVNKESEPLLIGVTSSDDDEKNSDQQHTPVAERVQMYNAPKTCDDDSSVPEDEENEEDEEADDHHDDGPKYVEQESEDEQEMNEIPSTPVKGITHHNEWIQNVPTFDAAAAAAVMSSVTSENQDISNSIAICEGELVASPEPASPENTALMCSSVSTALRFDEQLHSLATLPPPPPPPGEKKKKRKKTGKRGKIAPIAPPPEEKLRKWEEEKKNKFDRLMAGKSSSYDVKRCEPDEKITLARLCPSSNALPSKSPSVLARSPSNMETLTDKKTAEKIILASSAAAVSFEQRIHAVSVDATSNGELPKEWNDGDSHKPKSTDNCANSFLSSLSPNNQTLPMDEQLVDDKALLKWLSIEVLGNDDFDVEDQGNFSVVIRGLLENDQNFNLLCRYMADCVNNATNTLGDEASFDGLTVTTTVADDESYATTDVASVSEKLKPTMEKQRPLLRPVVLSRDSQHLSPNLLAANFVSFLYLASKLTKIPSPFGNSNPFLVDIVNVSLQSGRDHSSQAMWNVNSKSPQQVIFDNPLGRAEKIVAFAHHVCTKSIQEVQGEKIKIETNKSLHIDTYSNFQSLEQSEPSTPCAGNTTKCRRFSVPDGHPSPFETAIWNAPRIIPALLSFLGDPVAVCRMKMVNRYCRRLVSENEHMLMKDAVRVGGLSMNIRPSFWMWIALQKCQQEETSHAQSITTPIEFKRLEQKGKEGKWHHVIIRDVERSFGNMPPHKTGARLRTDSIVRALVTWGKNRIMRRGVKGGGEETPLPELGSSKKHKEKPARSSASPPPWECSIDRTGESDWNEIPTNKVSDWEGVSPVASMADSSTAGLNDDSYGQHNVLPREELALSGNCLTGEMKSNLQNKLSFILNALAAAHDEVGYCQGMDYVVAHLLRILQDTIRWKAVQNHLPPCIVSASTLPDLSDFRSETMSNIYEEVDKSLVVEEVVFRVMDTFFTSYNLRHMYWPELRCLKTCCRVFERLIQIKLPVLADHFEHHDLNVGLFALGWFQTLFLYLPSMPSATVCHMWDIWLVERSFKIFFRVGTAILFLSQPILLNHELEGMMTYLNTIPDATLLKPDILIACALNIKVTNRMLQELEAEVTSTGG